MLVNGFYIRLRKEELKLWRNNNGHPSSNRVQRLVADLHQTLGCDLKCGAWQREETGNGSLFEREIKPFSLIPPNVDRRKLPKVHSSRNPPESCHFITGAYYKGILC